MTKNTEAVTVNYKLDIQNPALHYAYVVMDISDVKNKFLDIKMPVWTPGSYMIREFERNIDGVSASSNGGSIKVNKTDKSTWRIENPAGLKQISVSYRVYCFENSVRTSYIDSDHAFLLPSSCLMYTDKMGAGSIEFSYPETWPVISTTLSEIKQNKYAFTTYDELADSPVEIGMHTELSFTVGDVKHKVAMVGQNNCNTEKFIIDLQKICKTTTEIIGHNPCSSYLFIVHHVDEGGGGLEHANSSVVQMPRFAYSNKERYLAFLSLCAHEYFHLWNIKRIRPVAYGPFDYSKENYSNLLWVAEGITSYYDELLMYRAGFRTESEYLKTLAGTFSAVLNRKGAEVQSLHNASYDAWIKEYRPNENSINSSISYYMKGAAIAALLDLELLSATNGKKGLDHLMRYLYSEFYEKKKSGFTDDEFYNAINTVAGKDLNFRKWAEEPNNASTNAGIEIIFKKASCSVSNRQSENPFYTGINTEIKGEKLLVKSIDGQSPAYGTDLQAGDEIIAIDGVRVKNNLDDIIKQLGNTEVLTLLISRAGIIRTVNCKPIQNPKLDLQITIDKGDDPILKAWLKKSEA